MELRSGDTVQCTVTRISAFGVFVALPDGAEGLIHVSELANHSIAHPEEVVAIGDEFRAVVLHTPPVTRRIGLSRSRASRSK